MPSFSYKCPFPLQRGVFKKRLNRFSALIEIFEQEALAHVPNSGRLTELLAPGRTIYLADKRSHNRKTSWDLMLSIYNKIPVCIDARVPNIFFHKMMEDKEKLPFFYGYNLLGREPAYGRGRFDFLLKKGEKTCFLEIKSVTLVKEKKALFPDAPTIRGARHLEELAEACGKGFEASCLFAVQRKDADIFSPNDIRDPGFGQALRIAADAGVALHALLIPPRLEFAEDENTASCYIEALGDIPITL